MPTTRQVKADANSTMPGRPLAVTMGDPAGIGLDITLKAWANRQNCPFPPFVLFADPAAVAERSEALGLGVDVAEIVAVPPADRLCGSALTIVPVHLSRAAKPGTPDAGNAPAIILAIEAAVASVQSGLASAVVTNPIAKAVLYEAGFRHPGHTEFLAELAARYEPARPWHPVMLLACDDLRVVPLTIHIPLAAVAGQITVERIKATVHIVVEDLRRRFAIAKPRLAVAGLNPHAGEGGSLGREEIEIIGPAIASLQAEGIAIEGPFSADTMFHAAARSRYDAAICMYHDQALIPLKTLAFDDGVNVTLGLPFVRTSPDHGTAFDIAATGLARPESFVAALRLADRMANASPPDQPA